MTQWRNLNKYLSKIKTDKCISFGVYRFFYVLQSIITILLTNPVYID